jgi:hypothetical protein
MALAIDTVALRLCLHRIAPPKKDRKVSAKLPKVKTASDESIKEDETILGLSEIGWDDPHANVWIRKKGESLSQLRQRVGRDAGCLEGELC